MSDSEAKATKSVVAPRITSNEVFVVSYSNNHEGVAGTYTVIVMLAVPGREIVKSSLDFDDFGIMGDSLLDAPSGATGILVRIEDEAGGQLDLNIGVNDKGRLRDVQLSLDASNFEHAARRAYDLVMPLLSRWAFLHNTALTAAGTRITESSTGSMYLQTVTMGQSVPLADGGGKSTPELRSLLSSYRDGLNSLEPFWQALAFLRVGDGVLSLQDERSRDLGERRAPRLVVLDKVDDPEAKEVLSPHGDKKLRGAFKAIRENLRNPIAHLDRSTSLFAVDQYDDRKEVLRQLPALRWVARELLREELESA